MKTSPIFKILAVLSAFFIVQNASAQNAGTVTNHAFSIGKGAGTSSFTSLLCTSAQLAVGQAAADPICQTITGDVTINAGGVTALGNIPNGTPMAGSLLATAIAAPSTPAAGKDSVWVDSTDKRLHDKNDAGTIGTTVVADTGAANNFMTSISGAGIIGKARPACASLSDASVFCNGTSAANLTGTIGTASVLAATAASHAVPVDVAGVPTWKVVPDCQDTTGNHLNYTQSTDAFSCGNTSSSAGGSTTIIPPQGRLTLQSGSSIMTADQANKTSVFYDCHRGGNLVPYYNGSIDNLDTIASCEVSDAMVSAASAGQIVSGQVYDFWWVHGGANRICAAMSTSGGGGGGWASDTGGTSGSRGTGYTQLDFTTRPYITNKNIISNCFNAATNYGPVSANQGTYLGTGFATANGQMTFQFKPAAASGGSNTVAGLFNAYNQILVTLMSQDSVASYTYNSTTWRHMNNNANNRVRYVDGLGTSWVQCKVRVAIQANASGGGGSIGCVPNWSSGAANIVGGWFATTNSVDGTIESDETFSPLSGLVEMDAVEAAASANATTFFGSGFGSPAGQTQSLKIQVRM